MPERYGVVSYTERNRVVDTARGAFPVSNHTAYTNDRDQAIEAYEKLGGSGRAAWIEREEPSFSQRGALAFMTPRHCRACDEGVCTLTGHQIKGEANGEGNGKLPAHEHGRGELPQA